MAASPPKPRTAVIVGPGFGGCVAALRPGSAGYRTTVLERGRRWDTEGGDDAFPLLMAPDRRVAWFADNPSINHLTRITPIERYPGLVDRIHGHGADAVFGAGVGGGSLTFGKFSIQPRRREWEQLYPDSIGYDEMDSIWFPLAMAETGVSPLPDDLLARPEWRGARAWLDTVADAGLEATRHHFAMDWDRVREELDGRRTPSVSVGEYLYGTNSGVKLSLDRKYLARAAATGVNGDGHREVLGMQVATSETKASWNTFFADLVARSLGGVRLATSDAHAGLAEAIAANLPAAAWQRCRTHYAANLMAVCPKSMWPAVKAMLHSVYDQPTAEAVNAQFDRLIEYTEHRLPEVADHLGDAREDLLAFNGFPDDVWRQIWSNNPT